MNDDTKITLEEQVESDEMLQKCTERAEELERKFYDENLPPGYEFHDGWLIYTPPSDKEPKPVKICSRLEVIARTRDAENLNHGRLIRFWDPDEVCHEWAMPMKLFASDGKEYRAELLDMGLLISNERNARSHLSTYLQQAPTTKTLRCVSQTGWAGNCFVLPGKTFGASGNENVIFQSDHTVSVDFKTQGTIQEFQDVAQLAIGNDLMIFSISLAFAPPLVFDLDLENSGFNLVGPSSTGKTKCVLSYGVRNFVKDMSYGSFFRVITLWRNNHDKPSRSRRSLQTLPRETETCTLP